MKLSDLNDPKKCAALRRKLEANERRNQKREAAMQEALSRELERSPLCGPRSPMIPDLANRAAIVARVICRQWYGVDLKDCGAKLPELLKIGFAVTRALDRFEVKDLPLKK